MSFFDKLFGRNSNTQELESQVSDLTDQLASVTSELEVAQNQPPEQVVVEVPADMVAATAIAVQVNSKSDFFTVDDFNDRVAGQQVRRFVTEMFEGTGLQPNFDHLKSLTLNLSNGSSLTLGLDDLIPSTEVIAESNDGATISAVVGSQTSGSGA